MTLAYTTVIQVIVLRYFNCFLETKKRNYETFNEVTLFFVMYSIICFTGFVEDVEIKYNIGYLSIFFVSSHLVVSILIMGSDTVKSLKHKYRRMVAIKNYKKSRQEF